MGARHSLLNELIEGQERMKRAELKVHSGIYEEKAQNLVRCLRAKLNINQRFIILLTKHVSCLYKLDPLKKIERASISRLE